MLALTIALLACGGKDHGAPGDTSYDDYPFLQAAAARCVDPVDETQPGKLVLTARTRGWHEYADVHVYVPSSGASRDFLIRSEFARQDEWCDFMRGNVPLSELGVTSCAELDLERVWLAFRVSYEEGCAGCAHSVAAAPDILVARLGQCASSACDARECFLADEPLFVELGAEAEACEPNPPPARD